MAFLGRFGRRGRRGGTSGGYVQPGGRGPTVRGPEDADVRHLEEFCATRRGVEGFIEPRTTVTAVTLLLVAHDGEWTRRRVTSEQWAREFAGRHEIPAYDAGLVGIPDRMRDYIRRQKHQQG